MFIRSLKECKYSKTNKSESPQEFERLVRDCAAVEFGKAFHLYGRSGQAQHGIDIFSDDWSIVIQCKHYKSQEELADNIAKDYAEAKEYFSDNGKPIFKTFIAATSLDTDTNVQDVIKKLGSDVDVWFWEDICNIITNYRTHNDNEDYVSSFTETLFLHKSKPGCEHVTLDKLFVLQEYCEGDNTPKDDLEARIKTFLRTDEHNLMIIEGDAGSGKSSLVGWMNYTAQQESDRVTLIGEENQINTIVPVEGVFDNRPIITIRLRDLRRKLKGNDYELCFAIADYMNLPDDNPGSFLKEHFPKAVFVLDGFDELCMINGLRDYEDLITAFCGWVPKESKIIITSRPKYINTKRLREYYIVFLQHFSVKKRTEWLEKYMSLFADNSELIDSRVVDYIKSVDSESVKNICDTPLTLYMLVGSNAAFELTDNIWSLYHFIFSKAIVDTEYSDMNKPESGTKHPMLSKSELIYRITEEIAFKMHCAGGETTDNDVIKTGDGKFLITTDGVGHVIENLMENEEFKLSVQQSGLTVDDLKRGHVLCCYWTSGEYVEFYHNNIRDFFMCERIYRVVNEKYATGKLHTEGGIKELAELFRDMFRYGALSDVVCAFLHERARNDVANNKTMDFPIIEKTERVLPSLFEYMLLNGRLYERMGVDNLIQTIEYILHGTAQVYRYIYEPILEDDEYIHWWNDVSRVNDCGIIQLMCKPLLFEIGYRGNLEKLILIGCDLYYCNFYKSNLKNSILDRACLYFADLQKANLCGAFMFRTILSSCDLENADLRYADLSGADLTCANLDGTLLQCTLLPGGIHSDDQSAQIAHLKSLNIPGLQI